MPVSLSTQVFGGREPPCASERCSQKIVDEGKGGERADAHGGTVLQTGMGEESSPPVTESIWSATKKARAGRSLYNRPTTIGKLFTWRNPDGSHLQVLPASMHRNSLTPFLQLRIARKYPVRSSALKPLSGTGLSCVACPSGSARSSGSIPVAASRLRVSRSYRVKSIAAAVAGRPVAQQRQAKVTVHEPLDSNSFQSPALPFLSHQTGS